MVGMVIVSHSYKIAEGVKELALQMASEVPIAIAGGTKDRRIGTDIDIILSAIDKVYSEDGVIILFDLGSALMNAEMALDFLPEDRKKVEIVDTALVEGAITGAVEISMEKTLAEVKAIVEEMKLGKKG
ncbi:dihydroxyacetone kinase phosphotransfer subunit [Clostridium tetanomorphum]|uniref:phosphoenolpyruvate--glycerone phosphotransferase n=1 Tax=Clostridium tetanomorphum TaxID=1553 RepID=A0A923J0V0_CLOTT|nr:dihydroxyacetone kinase phosphoryl donor subunit DhaM [Clostridium tetanomorphum]KAJ53454.1 PTS system mannnose-specific family transporter subunit IIA [Clostridium tetanomorphum DSM 665]MBC2398472.1 PTS-dependent dihydroxyacetone kinase phosphotransferase subunit DhaM [Clostridium tetanomorphum]MBP1865317.1 dihydroxyacetone kinase phosphotransfer subunit [Clostridium tetanomorphum]NRS85240.1 dihydroxyacetone kinase phosphotransfer subunit [Clostridium tetanomorphum]NRZ98417.1 dihydroxyacet